MKQILAASGKQILRALPFRMRLALCHLICEASTFQGSRGTLVELFKLHELIEAEIDRCAVWYGNGVHPKHRLTKYHEFFAQRLRPGETVLDIGCGSGSVAYSMAIVGACVTGFDLSEENIHIARQRYQHPNLFFIVGDATKSLPRGQFNTVVASNVLEHIADRTGFLRFVQQNIMPERWLLRVPAYDRTWLIPLRQELGLSTFSDPTHVTEYTKKSFKEEMSSAGMTIRHIERAWGELWAEVTCA
jgi:2-polyprenyl-3-methyl-5-hydroxy-6-metoxy-1,4-benzoquinol methylase